MIKTFFVVVVFPVFFFKIEMVILQNKNNLIYILRNTYVKQFPIQYQLQFAMHTFPIQCSSMQFPIQLNWQHTYRDGVYIFNAK